MFTGPVGFKEAQRRLIDARQQGTFLHKARSQVETKNLLRMGRLHLTNS